MAAVSIIILTKNRAPLLAHALESVYRQSFRDWEIVLVDDGSTDNTESVIQQHIARGMPIIHIRHGASSGITRSRQEALLACTGRFVAMLDDDDAWVDARKLEKQMAYCDRNPDIVLAGGGIEMHDKLQGPRYI